MRLLLAGLACLIWTGPAAADSAEAERQRILKAALEKAYHDSERLPPLTDKDFIRWWRPAIAQLANETCNCDFGDKTCARLAMDEFYIDMAGVMFRIKGAREGMLKSEDPRKFGQDLSTALLNKHVPPKEQLRIQAKLEGCINHAVGIRYKPTR